MNTDSARDRFLAAEKEASELVEVLNQLREEMKNYSDARDSVEDAVSATQAVALTLAPVAERFGGLLSELENLGLLEFREDLTAVHEMAGKLTSAQDLLKGDLDASRADLKKSMKAVHKEHLLLLDQSKELLDQQTELRQLSKQMLEQQGRLATESKGQQKELLDQSKELLDQQTELRQLSKQMLDQQGRLATESRMTLAVLLLFGLLLLVMNFTS